MAGKRKSNNFIWIKSVIALFVICSISKIMTQLDIYLIAASVVILIFSLAIYYHQKQEHEREDVILSNKKIIDFNNYQHKSVNLKKFNVLKVEQLRKLTSGAFEEYIAQIYRQLGYKATVTPRTGDGGKDIILVDTQGRKLYIECKCYSKQSVVGRPVIQKLIGAAVADRAIPWATVTTGRFTKQAKAEAQKVGVKCIGPVEIGELMREAEEAVEKNHRTLNTHTV